MEARTSMAHWLVVIFAALALPLASFADESDNDDEPIEVELAPSETTQIEALPATDSSEAAVPAAETTENTAAQTPPAETADSTEQKLADLLLQPTLRILGSTVEPGSAEVVSWAVETTFADIGVPVPVLVVNGTKAGPTLCLTAAVHGDELNGIEIVRRVIHETNPKKLTGAIIGVPIVNLQGFQRANRYLPDRRDLNRYFPGRERGSYASRVAYSFFKRVMSHCSYLVDLHTGSLSRTNLPQIRANLSDPAIAALAEKMGSIVVLQSRGGVGTLRRAAGDAGIPAVTLEAGAPNNLQKEAVEEGVKTVKSALNSLGMSSKSIWKRSAEPIFYRSQWIRARSGGILFSKVELGDNVEVGTVLGLLSDPITNKTTRIKSPIAGRVIGMALNQVMYPGFAAYHVGLKSSMVEAAEKEDLMPDDELSEDTASTLENGSDAETVKSSGNREEPLVEQIKTPIKDMELPTAEVD